MINNYIRIGFEIELLFGNLNSKKINNEKIYEVGKYVKNVLDKLNNINNKLYLFVPYVEERDKQSKKIMSILRKLNINFSRVIFCGNDLVGAIREFRTDIIVLSESKMLMSNKDSSFIEKDLSVIEAKYRKIYHRQDKICNKRVLELENFDLFADHIPQYTQIIYVGNNEKNFENSNRIQFVKKLYEIVNGVIISKKMIEKRIENINKSYDYKPKTGIVSIDEDWNRYWETSKFENDYFDQKLQKLSRLEFLEYHNRFNLNEIMIDYLPLNIKLTYKEVFKRARVLCNSFSEIGVKKGTVVTTCMPNTIEDYLCELALNHIGAIINPLHPLATMEKLERFFRITKPEYFLCLDMDDSENTIDLDVVAKNFGLKEIIVVSQVASANPLIKIIYNIQRYFKQKGHLNRYILPNQYIKYNELYKLGLDYDYRIECSHNFDDSAFYYTTGGTTSNSPKIVDIPYSLINNSYYNSYGIDVEKGEAAIINYPRYIAFSDSNCTHLPASAGLRLIMTPFEYPKDFAKIMQDKKISVIQVAPQFYQMMLDDEKKGSFDNIDLSHVRFAVAGGDKYDQNLKDKVRDFFARHNNSTVQIITGYGCTELNGSCIVQLFGTEENAKENNVGVPLPNFKFKLVDDDFREINCKKNQGRLLIGGNGMTMNGYLNQNESTNEVLFRDEENNFNWYDTADIVKFHSTSNVRKNEKLTCEFITREKRFVMITRPGCSGKAIPDDIENIIQKNIPGILKCSVVGVVENNQMTLRAAVVLEDGISLDSSMIEAIKQVCSNTDIINTLSEVISLDSLPLTDRQKINYREVEKIFEDRIVNSINNKVKVKK